MSAVPVLDRIAALPGIRGCLHCNALGDTVHLSGGELELDGRGALALQRLGTLAGEALGLGALREAEFHARRDALVCMPYGDGAIIAGAGSRAAICDAAARLHESLS